MKSERHYFRHWKACSVGNEKENGVKTNPGKFNEMNVHLPPGYNGTVVITASEDKDTDGACTEKRKDDGACTEKRKEDETCTEKR